VTEKSRTRMAFMMYQRNISAAAEIILRALLALISGLNSVTCPKRRRTLYGKNTVQSSRSQQVWKNYSTTRGSDMTIDCAFFGFVAADADARTSKAGKPWTRLRVGVGRDDDVQWVSVSVFGKAAESATTLKKGDRVYCEGSIKLDTWRGNDGTERHTLAV